MAFEVRFAASARRQLKRLSVPERVVLVAAVEAQLQNQPLTETRNRKPLRPNPLAPWELRVGDLRVFYEVDEPGVVTVLAIGEKRGNKLYIEGEEIDL